MSHEIGLSVEAKASALIYLAARPAKGHLLGHVQQEPAVIVVCLAQQTAKLG